MPYPVAARGHIYKPTVATNGLLNNLVGYWGLDEAGGANNALDKHTNALTLTQSNSPGSDTGLVYAGARTFTPASTQYFSRASETILQAEDKDFTFAAWVYLSTTSGERPIVVKYTGAGNEYMLRYNGTTFRWIVGDNGGGNAGEINWTGTVNASTWYLVLAYHDSGANSVGISVNAGTVYSAATSGPAVTGTAQQFDIGKWTTNYFQGRIGPVMMWKSTAGGGGVLDSTKRTALYNAGAGLAYASFTT